MVVCLCGSPVIGWRAVQGGPRLSLDVSWLSRNIFLIRQTIPFFFFFSASDAFHTVQTSLGLSLSLSVSLVVGGGFMVYGWQL